MDDEGDAATPTRRRFGRHDVLVLGTALALVLIVIGVAVVVYQHRSAALPRPAPTASTQSPPVGSGPDQGAPTSSVSRRELGRALLPDAMGYEIIGFGPQGLARLRPDRGTVIETSVAATLSQQRAVVAGQGFVVGGAVAGASGFVFVDGEPAQRTTGELAYAAQTLPGPYPARVWVVTQASPDEQPSARPVGADGVATSAGISLPYGAQAGLGIYADGTGFLVVNGIDGWYHSGPTGLRRITSGALLAIGPTRWLTTDCDQAGRCMVTVTDRRTRERRTLPTVVPTGVVFPGVISPDGRWAVLATDDDRTGTQRLTIIDLTTGVRRAAQLRAGGPDTTGRLVWSPDSRWLLALDHRRGLVGIDPRTGRATAVAGELPRLTAITVRTD